MKKLTLSAGDLSVTFKICEGGAVISGIRDEKTGASLLSYDASIFTLTVRAIETDDETSVTSNDSWEEASFVQTPSGAMLVLSGNKKLPMVTVTLNAVTEKDKITFTTSLVSASSDFSLLYCDYVNLSFNVGKDVTYFQPYGCGSLHASDEEEFKQTENYPSYGIAMEYLCFFNKKLRRGIYYGIHDPAPAYKKLCVERVKGNAYMTVKSILPLTDIDVPRNSQSMAGKLVWQIFDGDWYDAALLYRDFVTTEAAWMPKTLKDGHRSDTPDWMVRNSHWWRIRMKDDDGVVDSLLKAQEILGVPSCCHLYDWHKNPYDNDYPHYFPVKDAMPTVVRRLQEKGIRVMPYINGRLWDTRDRGLEDWKWSSLAKPCCTKDRHGKPFIETYGACEADGNKVQNSIMCPSTALWQEKVQENVRTLLYNYNCDGVYIDQIGASSPYLCEDRGHAHRPGGGSWWVEGYRNLLDHVNMNVPDRKITTTECNADPYARHFDGYLTWLWVHNDQVPAYPVVYSGLVSMFGRHYDSVPVDDGDANKIIFVESLMFGDQMGWIMPERFLEMPYRDFYVRCVRLRQELASFYYAGRCLRPPVITDNGDVLFSDKSKESPKHILRHQATFAACWQRNDGAKAYIFANACDKNVRATVKCDIADGVYTLNTGKKITFRGGKAVFGMNADTAVYFTVNA